jgi:hypothetical protein
MMSICVANNLKQQGLLMQVLLLRECHPPRP